MEFEITFRGHENVRCLHRNALEVTADAGLTARGDCIAGVGASCGCAGLPAALKRELRDPGREAAFELEVGGLSFAFQGAGDPGLELSHPRDVVLRRTGFVCPRTAGVRCGAGSDSVPREMVKMLRDPSRRGTLRISSRRRPSFI